MKSLFPPARTQSLRSRICLRTAPIALGVLLLASFYPARNVSKEFSKRIEAQLQAESVHLAQMVERKLAGSAEAVAAVAANEVVVNGVIDPEHRKSTLQSFMRSVRLPGASVQNVVMTDYQGVAIASKFPVDRTTFSSENKIVKLALSGRQVVAVQNQKLTVAYPVLYSGQPEAAIIAIYPVSDFFGDVCVGSTTTGNVVRHCEEVIATSDARFRSDTHQLLVPEKWLVDTAPVRNLPDLSVSVVHSNATAEQATSAVGRSLLFVIATALIVLLAALWIGTSMATAAIHNFLSAIDDVQANANLNRRVNADTSAEFVLLGERFNAMLEEIKNSTVSRDEYRIPALVAKYTDNAVIVTDANGYIEWVNEAFTRITGYGLHEIVGLKPGSFLQGPETDPASIQRMAAAIKSSKGVNVEILNYHKSGSTYWVDVEIRPIHSDDGQLIKFIAIESDVTARVEAEARQEQLNRRMVDLSRQAGKAEVATGVLHNVGNALTSVNVSANVLMRSFEHSRAMTMFSRIAKVIKEHDDDLPAFFASDRGRQFPVVVRELSERMDQERVEGRDEAERLIRSVDHIKQVVTKQQGNARARVICEQIDAAELVTESLRIRNELISTSGTKVIQQVQAGLTVHVDRHMTIEIMENLIGNAVQATGCHQPADRQVTIRLFETSSDSVLFSVKDNGVGISAENLEKIFNHGFTTREEGHGFGLHASILAAESMGANLSASSDGVGHGAEFVLRMPRTPSKTTRNEVAPKVSGEQSGTLK